LIFEGNLNTHSASVETMLGNIQKAISYYEHATSAFETLGHGVQAQHCKAMVVRLKASGVDEIGGGQKFVAPLPVEVEKKIQIKDDGVSFIMDTEGIDSDDELGEELSSVE
tara:strand:- start:85 stop:417 length:333 start_codon:yes stop_codon:yes gene_type:complete